ncbi:MAG: hypothetical protein KIT85_19360 [Pseudolabrys sp.]|nr:hypothetical protein [Pseudolabrys sp.]
MWYNVYCFAKPEQAEAFRQRFGGKPFDPKKRKPWWSLARLGNDMTGYEKSPDYGGPEPDFGLSIPMCIIAVLIIVLTLALVRF